MIFSSKATKGTPKVAHRVATLATALGLALVASCGGGTTQYETFQAQRLLVFGDDTSALTQDGRNYSINGVDATGAIDCTSQPIWVQSVASVYGFSFAECNPGAAVQTAFMQAYAGAKVSDVAAQVEAQVAAGGFRDKDLATVLAGTNDILELYAQFPSRDEASITADARARGKALALVVNRLVALGAKVIISDLPDVGLTPYAADQNRLAGSTAPSDLMNRLTTAFNEQLGVNVLLDGRYVGLVQAQLRFQAVARAGTSFGFVNITDVACTAVLPGCTTATLTTDATPGDYLWADATHFSPGGQAQLAALAVDRARRNPF